MAGTDARSPLLLGLILGFGVIIAVLVAARALGLPAKPRRADVRAQGAAAGRARPWLSAPVAQPASRRPLGDAEPAISSGSAASHRPLGDTEPAINAGSVSFTAG